MKPSSDEIVLITRVRTNNKGNQALSAAWAAMLGEAFPGASVRALERRPRHLLQHSLRQIRFSFDPFRTFDRIATRLAKLAPGPSFVGPPTAPPSIELDEKISATAHFGNLRAKLNLRGWAARAGLYREEYQRRLAAAQRARLVIVNPAGEFFPDDPTPALYHLLDAYVIHKLGVPTGIVNHTMDIADPTLRKLIPQIYRRLPLIGFRDEKSIGAFEKMGGDTRNVFVTPDLALTTLVPTTDARRPNKIAVAVHTPDAENTNRTHLWFELVEALRAKGWDVVLVSNEQSTDHNFFKAAQARIPDLQVEGFQLGYDRYAALLGSFDFVVSSRMHTSILALCAGTPVIPVEGPSFKITGLFQELGAREPVLQSSSPRFIAEVVERATAMKARRDDAARESRQMIAEIRQRITGALLPRLQAAGRS